VGNPVCTVETVKKTDALPSTSRGRPMARALLDTDTDIADAFS
jgi:hypothetical protein